MPGAHRLLGAVAAAMLVAIPAAQAEEIAVANYGSSVSGMPWVVALEKGFFKEAGAPIAGIRGSTGGSTEIRAMIAGELAYVDTGMAAHRRGCSGAIVIANRTPAHGAIRLTRCRHADQDPTDLWARVTFTTPLSTEETIMLVAKRGSPRPT